MHTTILIEGRQVGIEVSDAVLHTRGEFCGNLHVPLGFDHPISTETVLEHLRIKLPGSDDLYDAIAHGEKAGGLEMIFSVLDDPSLDPFPPDKIPNMVELLWVEENMPTRLGEVAVQTVVEEPDPEPESPDGPNGGSGCAGVLLAVLAVASGVLLLAGLAGCPNPSSPTGASTQPGAPSEVTEETLVAAIPDDSFRLSIGKGANNDTETAIRREFLIDVPSSAKRIVVMGVNPASHSTMPLHWWPSEAERRCTFSVSWELLTGDGLEHPKAKGTWSIAIPKKESTVSSESAIVEGKGLLDVVPVEAEPGLYKQGERVALGSLNGQEMTLYVSQQVEDTVPEAD